MKFIYFCIVDLLVRKRKYIINKRLHIGLQKSFANLCHLPHSPLSKEEKTNKQVVLNRTVQNNDAISIKCQLLKGPIV